MSSNHVRQSIIARVQNIIAVEGWNAIYLDIENTRKTPPTDGDFLAVEFIGSDETQLTTGAPHANVFRETGDFLIHYCTESNTGAINVLDRLELIRDQIRFTDLDCIVIDAVNPPDTTPGASLATTGGNWFGGSILTSYEYDIRG